ncbi:MAG: HAMP domain-containing histidine kinase [Deltaproteobacteria bacterium]|nr:MAG: HAMP domain-containing histidine kinase [Deltaproteobacteria bacterium]
MSRFWPRPADPTDEGRLWLLWLIRLRWVAIVAQLVTVAFAHRLLASPALLIPLGAISAMLIAGNAAAIARVRREDSVDQRALLFQLGLDVVSLTGFFVLAGGPDNPFTALYFIHAAMGAVILHARGAAAIGMLTTGCYLLLHGYHLDLDLTQHSLDAHTLIVLGRTVAFGVTTASVVGFVVTLANARRRRERQLLEARDRTARVDRLRSVGTLAAGAAHELNTPLSTIGLRLRRVARRHKDDDTVADLDTIRNQLDRCSRIVDQLLVGAGDPSAAHLERRALGELVSSGVKLWSKGATTPVTFEDTSEGLEIELPAIAFTQALVNLLENGREAQEEVSCTDALEVRVERDGRFGVVRVVDHGVGLPNDVDRVGDPFYTTKDTGTGLGVFVARAVADGSGGGLRYESVLGSTHAVWWFPETSRRNP